MPSEYLHKPFFPVIIQAMFHHAPRLRVAMDHAERIFIIRENSEMLGVTRHIEQGQITCLCACYRHFIQQRRELLGEIRTVWLFGIGHLVITRERLAVFVLQAQLIHHADNQAEAITAFAFKPRLVVKRCADPCSGLGNNGLCLGHTRCKSLAVAAVASILSMPYAILAGSLPPERMGVYMGIFNFFIVIPQITAAGILGYFMRTFFGNQAVFALILGGISMLIAAGMTMLVKDEQ